MDNKFTINSIFKWAIIYKSVLLILVAMLIILTNLKASTTFRLDSFIIVIGNLLVAIFITHSLTNKHKKNEISLDHCIKDISELLVLLKEIKTEIEELELIKEEKAILKKSIINKVISIATDNSLNHKQNIEKKKKQEIVSKSSIFYQLILMLTNHPLIQESHLKNINDVYKIFEEHITGNDTISEEWFDSVLKLQRHLLIIKKDVIKEFREL